ncbi:hypothetical protein C8Q76DRAFT_792288 [Earliella scabrosa]|nr:hypothetical protein C8Q76DRAFT_792281 [Earliella scabrosa]KAI0735781.1 hypothetical protein C8Q76DRAFT_792288 [Earliella scabrosa]
MCTIHAVRDRGPTRSLSPKACRSLRKLSLKHPTPARSAYHTPYDPTRLCTAYTRHPSSTMATMEGLEPHIYLLYDVSAQRMGTIDSTQSVVVLVNGPAAVMTLILPTAPHTLALCPPSQFDDWVQAALGREFNNCEAPDPMRDIVLQIGLLYQAFFYNIDEEEGINMFRLWVEQLVGAAIALVDHEPAEFALARVLNWAHTVLPAGIFWNLGPPALDTGAGYDIDTPVPEPDNTTRPATSSRNAEDIPRKARNAAREGDNTAREGDNTTREGDNTAREGDDATAGFEEPALSDPVLPLLTPASHLPAFEPSSTASTPNQVAPAASIGREASDTISAHGVLVSETPDASQTPSPLAARPAFDTSASVGGEPEGGSTVTVQSPPTPAAIAAELLSMLGIPRTSVSRPAGATARPSDDFVLVAVPPAPRDDGEYDSDGSMPPLVTPSGSDSEDEY